MKDMAKKKVMKHLKDDMKTFTHEKEDDKKLMKSLKKSSCMKKKRRK